VRYQLKHTRPFASRRMVSPGASTDQSASSKSAA
jgi:hypothetical protein